MMIRRCSQRVIGRFCKHTPHKMHTYCAYHSIHFDKKQWNSIDRLVYFAHKKRKSVTNEAKIGRFFSKGNMRRARCRYRKTTKNCRKIGEKYMNLCLQSGIGCAILIPFIHQTVNLSWFFISLISSVRIVYNTDKPNPPHREKTVDIFFH